MSERTSTGALVNCSGLAKAGVRILGTQPDAIDIAEDRRRLFERDAMFLEVGNGLRDVPGKHICVYTLIRPRSQGLRAQTVYLV